MINSSWRALAPNLKITVAVEPINSVNCTVELLKYGKKISRALLETTADLAYD
jgi:hypothetical protein